MSARDKQINGDHYKTMAIQPSEYIHRNGLGWHEGNAVKYITRHRLKGGRIDIEKAIHYLELLLEAEYPVAPAAKPLHRPGLIIGPGLIVELCDPTSQPRGGTELCNAPFVCGDDNCPTCHP